MALKDRFAGAVDAARRAIGTTPPAPPTAAPAAIDTSRVIDLPTIPRPAAGPVTTEISSPQTGTAGYVTGGGGLFKNLEAFPGQILYTPPKLSARQEGQRSRGDVVRAARAAERTSEPIRGGIDRKADMTVGVTLRVHAQPDWDLLGITDWETKKPFAQACQREFNNWAYDSRLLQDGEGHYNFGAMMWMAFRNLVGPDAECAGIIHYDEPRQIRFRARWATYVTIVDPDRISTPADQVDKTIARHGYEAFEGRMIDGDGRMLGYWLANRHPSEGVVDAADAGHTFVPRETYWGRAVGFHFFVKTRGGQQRGVSTLTTILRKTGMLDSFDDAHLGSAIVNQVLSNYIETMASPETVAEQLAPAGENRGSPFDDKVAYYGKAKISVGGQRVPVLPPGDKIVMSAVDRSTQDPTLFRNNFLREFASALGISFEQLSMNFSDANYSAARAALLEVWRGIMTMRRMFTAHVASLIYAAVIEEAVAAGRIVLPAGAPPFQENRAAYTACMWTGPGMGWIDPQKEANAIETLLRIRLKSRSEAKAEMDGGDYLETFDQIEQEDIEAEERNFSLDLSQPGSMAAATGAGDDPAATPEDPAPTDTPPNQE